jgi:hypothetical protein
VIIGGFHTSGTINMLGEQEPDIQALVEESISIGYGTSILGNSPPT